VGTIFDEEKDALTRNAPLTMTPDFGVVDLLRKGLIALSLLPENSTAGTVSVFQLIISQSTRTIWIST